MLTYANFLCSQYCSHLVHIVGYQSLADNVMISMRNISSSVPRYFVDTNNSWGPIMHCFE